MFELKPCPFCGGKVSFVLCDDEGNLHDEAYREHPYSGLGFMLHHAHKAESLIFEYRRERKEYLWWKEHVKGDVYADDHD